MDAWTTLLSNIEVRFIKQEILALARKHGIAYRRTKLDELAVAMTRLAGDDAELDEAGELVLALQRAGHMSDAEANRLHAEYLRAKYA